MITIYKYKLGETDTQELLIPTGSEILCLQLQNNIPCLWIKVNPDNPQFKITIRMIGTGNPIPKNEKLSYIGTFQKQYGYDTLVFHIFQRLS